MQTMSSIFRHFSTQLILIAVLAMCLAACGGGGGGGGGQNNAMSPTPGNTSVFIPKPVLTFSDTGLSVTDGVTRNGRWNVDSSQIWEFSFDMGKTWVRGQGDTFDVQGDGSKIIWVRATDGMGNFSEIVMVNCVLDTMAPAPVQPLVMNQDLTRIVMIGGVEEKGQWEYSLDDTRTWLTGTGDRLAIMGNALTVLWLRQSDLAGNKSPLERVNLLEPNSTTWHEASGNPLQPSVLSLQQARTVVLHGSVVMADADYIRWDIPIGQSLKSVQLVHYVSSDQVAFYALQRSPVFDACNGARCDVSHLSRMLVAGHMGPEDLKRNVLEKLAPEQLTSGPMTLWFQQTGSQATEYAIELVFQ
jgi:hypothetical protein